MNFQSKLKDAGLKPTANRVKVMETIAAGQTPLTADEIHERISSSRPMNRVTVYRILELLVRKMALEKISSGERAFRYGLAGNPHPHFYCRKCGSIECLPTGLMDMHQLGQACGGKVERIEIRLEGLCRNCGGNRS